LAYCVKKKAFEIFVWERLSSRDQFSNEKGLIAAGKPLPQAEYFSPE